MNKETERVYYRAYMIYTDWNRTESAQYNDMQRFLIDEVKAGNITMIEKCKISHDILQDVNGYLEEVMD